MRGDRGSTPDPAGDLTALPRYQTGVRGKEKREEDDENGEEREVKEWELIHRGG